MCSEIVNNSYYAYVRISSRSQEENSFLETQKAKFIQQGVPESNIRVEIASRDDPIQDRPVFQKLIDDELSTNDLLLVTKIDQCSRSTLEFLKLQKKLYQKAIRFISLDLPYSSTDLTVNNLIETTLVTIANFENERCKERQHQGIENAKKAGRYPGRKTVITKKLIAKVQELKETNNLSITQIAKLTGKGRNTIYKILKQELNYNPSDQLLKQNKNKLKK